MLKSSIPSHRPGAVPLPFTGKLCCILQRLSNSSSFHHLHLLRQMIHIHTVHFSTIFLQRQVLFTTIVLPYTTVVLWRFCLILLLSSIQTKDFNVLIQKILILYPLKEHASWGAYVCAASARKSFFWSLRKAKLSQGFWELQLAFTSFNQNVSFHYVLTISTLTIILHGQ